MARRLKPQATSLYGTPSPLTNLDLIPIRLHRAPTTADTGYSVGQLLYDEVGNIEYVLTSVAGGVATWTALVAAAGTVLTLTDQTAAVRSPTVGGTITINGANNITTTGAANTVTVTGSLTPTFTSITAGPVEVSALEISTGGAADTAGLATLGAGGTISVLTTAITADSLIFLTCQTAAGAGAPGVLKIENVVVGTSFDITSTVATDVSDIAWMIVEPV